MPRLAVAPVILAVSALLLGGTLASIWLQPRAPEPAPPSFALPSAPIPAVPIPPKEVALDFDPWTAGGTPPPQPLLGNAPRVDVARLDADGRLTLGGRAVPGDRVRVALDGVERDAVPTDAQGVWVDLGTVLPDRTRAVLTVTAEDGNGVRHDGQQRVSLARAGTEAVILAEEAGGSPRLWQGVQARIGPAGLSLDAVNYDMEGALELAGIALPYATVRVLDGGRVLSAGKTDAYGAWSLLLPANLPTGPQRLRIAQFREDGALDGTMDIDLTRASMPEATATLPDRYVVMQPGGTDFVFARRLGPDDRPRLYLFETEALEPWARSLMVPGQILVLAKSDASARGLRVSAGLDLAARD